MLNRRWHWTMREFYHPLPLEAKEHSPVRKNQLQHQQALACECLWASLPRQIQRVTKTRSRQCKTEARTSRNICYSRFSLAPFRYPICANVSLTRCPDACQYNCKSI